GRARLAPWPDCTALRHAHRQRPGRVSSLRRLERETALLAGLDLERDLALAIRLGLPGLDARARHLHGRAPHRLQQRVLHRHRQTVPTLAERRAIDRDAEPLRDVDPLRLREVADVE